MDDYVARQLIVEAGRHTRAVAFWEGVDLLGKPVLAFFGSRFPDPAQHDYDYILQLCVRRLEDIVAREYVLVFFVAGMIHRPPLLWIVKAYRTLTRSFRKNIKRLYVVHPSWWFRVVLCLMKTIAAVRYVQLTRKRVATSFRGRSRALPRLKSSTKRCRRQRFKFRASSLRTLPASSMCACVGTTESSPLGRFHKPSSQRRPQAHRSTGYLGSSCRAMIRIQRRSTGCCSFCLQTPSSASACFGGHQMACC